jgi:hypothetical protein
MERRGPNLWPHLAAVIGVTSFAACQSVGSAWDLYRRSRTTTAMAIANCNENGTRPKPSIWTSSQQDQGRLDINSVMFICLDLVKYYFTTWIAVMVAHKGKR